MLPATATRVAESTTQEVNAQIRQRTEGHVACCAMGGRAAIDRRLRELDREWDIERALEANAASVTLLGTMLGSVVDRRWFVLPAIVGGFLLQHALQGWCPPVPVLRRLGFRTQSEIAEERYALKALRGDFRDLPQLPEDSGVVGQVMSAVRR